MDFNQFVDEVKGGIKLFLPREYEDAQVRVEEMRKLNENYLGIAILKENQVLAPTFNLNQLYEMYQSDPQISMESIMRNITGVVLDTPEQFDLKSITEYENAKEKLFIRVSSAEKNGEMLQNVPHQMREDLVITYHVAISMDEVGRGSTTITNDMLKRYGISEEQLHADAMESSPKIMPLHVDAMKNVIKQIIGGDNKPLIQDKGFKAMEEVISEGLKEGEPMFVITNQQTMDGASAIFYPEVMKQLGECFQGDFFILPSSIHETIVLPDKGDFDYLSLKSIVQEINNNQVLEEEQLTNDVYHYDVKERVFERADKFEKRQKVIQMNKDEKAGREQKMEHPKPKKHDMEL